MSGSIRRLFVPIGAARVDTFAHTTVAGSSNLGLGGNAVDNDRLAQSFQVLSDCNISALQFYAQKVGSPADNIIVEIQYDGSGVPNGTVIASYTFPISTLSTTQGWQSFFGGGLGGPVLNPGTVYWIVLRRSGASDGATAPNIAYGTGTYSGGTADNSRTIMPIMA
jgi:hypothetical protein